MANASAQSYLAVPSSDHAPRILALHAWWGLNDFFRGFCDRLAKEGFVVLAPDMFGGQVVKTIKEAEQHKDQWDEEHAVPPIILPAIEELSQRVNEASHGLSVIGFSMGAYWALWLALRKPQLIRSVVLFYGANGGGGDFRQSKAAFLGHFAEKDPFETEETIQALEKSLIGANRPTTFYTYPGIGHWFFESDRLDAYNAPAANLAWERTLSFLKSAS